MFDDQILLFVNMSLIIIGRENGVVEKHKKLTGRSLVMGLAS